MPFGEAPSAAAFSRCALAFSAFLFARVQKRAGRGDLSQELAKALARFEAATVIDDTFLPVEECAAELLHEQIRLAHEAWGLTMAPKKLRHSGLLHGSDVRLGTRRPLHLEGQAGQVAALPGRRGEHAWFERRRGHGRKGGLGEGRRHIGARGVRPPALPKSPPPLLYRTLANVAGRASSRTVRIGHDARAELGATIEFLRVATS